MTNNGAVVTTVPEFCGWPQEEAPGSDKINTIEMNNRQGHLYKIRGSCLVIINQG